MASHTQKLTPEQTTRRDFGLFALVFVLWWIVFSNLQPAVDFVTYRMFRQCSKLSETLQTDRVILTQYFQKGALQG